MAEARPPAPGSTAYTLNFSPPASLLTVVFDPPYREPRPWWYRPRAWERKLDRRAVKKRADYAQNYAQPHPARRDA